MGAIKIAAKLEQDGTLTLKELPFRAGQHVENIVAPVLTPADNRYPLQGSVYRYDDPFGPACPPEDWEALS